MHSLFWLENLKGRVHPEVLGSDGWEDIAIGRIQLVRWPHVNVSRGVYPCSSQKQKVLLELRLQLSRI